MCTAADPSDEDRVLMAQKSPGDQAFHGVPPAGFEPAHPPPEGGALSPELRGLAVGQGRSYQHTPHAPPTGGQGAGSGVPPRAVSMSTIVVTSAACVSAMEPARVRTAGSLAF